MDVAAKRVRQLDATGTGPTVILLQGEERPSPMVALLAQHFRVVRYAISDPGSAAAEMPTGELAEAIGHHASEPVGVVANAASANQTLKLVTARADLVRAIALVAPRVPDVALPELKTPVMALFGTRKFPQQIGRKMRDAIANCHVIFIYDADDDMADQRPEAVAATLREFLTAGDRFIVTGKSGKLYP
jgi:pimeloyl-ACP methyl ester carboxylesterase